MSRTDRLKKISAAFDVAYALSEYERICIYTEMVTFDEIRLFALEELERIKEHLIATRNYALLDVIKDRLYDIGIEFTYVRPHHTTVKTVYANTQNVHILAKTTEKAALNIIDAYPSCYERPKEFLDECYDHFFTTIQDLTYYAFEPRNLFASVFKCISLIENDEKRHSLMFRLKEEIFESDGMCLTGCIVRLVNSLRGFGMDQFETELDEYEHERSKAFHLLTKALEGENVDTPFNLIKSVKKLIKDKRVNLPKKYAIRILEAYTGVKNL